MKIDPNDPLFVERGIDPEIAFAQGFELWTYEDAGEVIGRAYEAIAESQRGSVQWLTQKARESGTGLIITRHSPIEVLNGKDGAVRPLVPEIRPDNPVRSGNTRRHYHGPPVLPWTLLPSVVTDAYCRPDSGFVRSYRIKFDHSHDELGPDEVRSHLSVWHDPDPDVPEPVDVVRRDVRGVHRHTLSVYPEDNMSEHINQGADGEAGKKTGAHVGVNVAVVHYHTPLAKYLFAPSQKDEEDWTAKSHNHRRMSESELEYHLTVHHKESTNVEPE